MVSRNILYNQSYINYHITGKGPAIMLVHGFAEDSSIWNGLVDELCTTYTLITPDIPGSGASALLPGNAVQLSDYAEGLYAILQKENITHCCFIGHSMGGYISLAFAEKYPALLTGLGLFHSSAYADDDAKKETRLKGIDFIKMNGPLAFLKTSIPGLFANEEKSRNEMEALLQKASAFSGEALVQYYNAMIARPDRTGVLKKSKVPVLFIMGLHDKAVPFEHSLQQAHLPAISYINILKHSAHMGMLEEKGKALEALTYFLHSIHVL